MLCVTTERLPLRRPRGGRWIGGVCRRLSAHLGMPVGVIRLVMVLLVPVGFTGPLLYVWFWVTVPAGDPVQAAMEQRPAALSRLAPRLRDPARKLPLTDIGVGLVLVIGASVLIGAALVLAPWWLRLVRELGDERAARARESERADIAAHLHDGVLQTLALIRSRSDSAEEVARLARAQERELREWLYDDRRTPGTSVATDLRAVVAEVEDTRAVAVDVVVVGDAVPDAGTEALLQATREALVNAVTHGRAPYSLYLEVVQHQVELFVRDHGDGFELSTVPTDRFGVRESIIGRVVRRRGPATAHHPPDDGLSHAEPVGGHGGQLEPVAVVADEHLDLVLDNLQVQRVRGPAVRDRVHQGFAGRLQQRLDPGVRHGVPHHHDVHRDRPGVLHLGHDGVLQTLALIRSRSGSAEDVARLARAQERELREWLYDDRRTPGTSVATDLRAVVAEVEDTRAVAVDVVVVG